MNILIFKRKLKEGNQFIPGHHYYNTYELEIGLNRIKLNATQHKNGPDYYGFVTWYPFSFYWWPPSNQWFRWRILGIKVSRGLDPTNFA